EGDVFGTGERDAGADRRAPRKPAGAGAGNVGVVVVVHRVAHEDRAAGGARHRGLVPGRAEADLRRGLVVVVLGVGDEPAQVVVELGVLDDQVAARVGARITQRRERAAVVVEDRVAVRAGADVDGGV